MFWNLDVKIAGILNITEDSFSDGGKFLDIEKAKEHFFKLFQSGADVVDIGAVSSNPQSALIPVEEEIRRLQPLLELAKETGLPVSVDTWRFEVQKFCLSYNVAFLNSITGFHEPEIFAYLKDTGTKLVIMHKLSRTAGKADPVDVPFEELWKHLIDFFDRKIDDVISRGIEPERILIDPGMGFFLGRDPLHSFRVINLLPELKKRYKLPLYVSVSRKSFLGAVTGKKNPVERDSATLAAEIALLIKKVDWIRTHTPGSLKDAIRVLQHIQT